MLDPDYLISLPKLATDSTSEFHFDRSPANLRKLWCTWASVLLGWAADRPRGHPRGFSEAVHEALAKEIFPFPKIDHDVDEEIEVASSFP